MKRIVAIILFLSCMLCLCACNIAYAEVENTAFSGLLQLHGEDTTTDGDSTPLVTIPEAGENTDIPAGEQSVQNPDEIPGNDQETPENTNDDSDTPYEIPNGQEDYQEQPVDYNLGLPNGVDSLEEFISLYARQMEEISSSLSENSMEIGYESVGVGEENIKPPFYCDKVMFACHPSPEGGMKPEETELLVKLFQFNSDEGEIYYQSDMEVTWYEFDGVDQYSSFDSFTEGKNYLLSVDFTVPVHCTLLDDVIVGLNNNAVRAEIRESERIISIRYYIMNFGSDGGFCSVRFENVPENDVRPYTRQSYATQIIATHNLPLLVDDPELEGFHFSGWFSDETMTRAFSFDDVIDEDTTIYAKWSADAPSVELLLGDVEASEKAVLPELMTDADVIVSAIGWSDTENGEPDYEGSLKAAQTYWLSGKICPTQTGVVWKENEFTVRVNGQAVASGLSETGTEIDFACPVVIQDKEHGHSIIYHEPVSAECENDGVMEYWECEKCGELFANEDLTVQISEDKLIIKATGHEETSPVRENEVPATCMKEGSYDEVIYCSVCNRELSRKKQTTEMAPHSPGELIVENRIDSTETMEGSYEEVTYCTVCNKELGREKKIIPRKTHIHNLVKVSAVGASCSKTGNIEHYVCLSCGQKFADEQGTRQIYNVVTQEKGHSWGEWRTTIAATANYEGRRERICGVCGQTEYESIPRLQSTSSGGSGSSGNYSYQGSGTSYINSGSSSGTNSTQQSQNSSVVSKTQNPATNNEYKFLEGGNATWKKGSEEGLHIMTSSIAKKLTSVYIDGNLLQVKNYKTNGTAENMNKPSEITLLPAVLETLDEGEHDIEIRYSDGKAVSKLIIKEKDPETSPTPAPTTSPTATPTISPSPTVSPEPTTPSDGETDPAAKQFAAKKNRVSKVMIPLVLIACTVFAGGLILYMNRRGVNLEDVFDSVKKKIRKN